MIIICYILSEFQCTKYYEINQIAYSKLDKIFNDLI